jgi:hypothetical protein
VVHDAHEIGVAKPRAHDVHGMTIGVGSGAGQRGGSLWGCLAAHAAYDKMLRAMTRRWIWLVPS